MLFFKSILEAGKIAIAVALLAIVLDSVGIRLFSPLLTSVPGLALFFTLLVFFVIYAKY